MDSEGNAYVTALSYSPESLPGGLTIKYDAATGAEQWARRFAPASRGAVGLAIAVDARGAVYVAGLGAGGCHRDSSEEMVCQEAGFIAKYSARGREIWVDRYARAHDSNVRFHAITVDPFGQPVVTGSISGGGSTNTEFVTVKYGSHGQRLWVARHLDPTHASVGGQHVVTDTEGNVIVTGGGFIVLKYSPGGRLLWEQREAGYAQDMALDDLGNIYLTGRLFNIYEDSRVVKYNPCGNRIWSFDHNTNGTAVEIMIGLALGPGATVHLAGILYPNPAATHLSDFLILRLTQTEALRPPMVSICTSRAITSERSGPLSPLHRHA